MYRSLPLILAALLWAVLPLPAAHAEPAFKVATVDVNRVLNSLDEAKRKKAELDKLQQTAKQEIDKKRERVKTLEQKVKDSKAGSDSPEAETLRNAIRDYERAAGDAEEDLKREFLKVNRDLTAKVMKAVATYADKHKIDLVLDKSSKGVSPVLYGDPTADITAEVLKELGS